MSQSLLPTDPAPAEPAAEAATEPTPAATPPAQESQRFATPPAEGEPPVEPPVEAGPVELTDELRERVRTEMREGVPEAPEGYELPPSLFEGKEGDALKAAQDELNASPLIQMVRSAAHELGMKPDAFQKFVGEYFAAEEKAASEAYETELKQLGTDEQAIRKRTGELAAAIQRTLPEAEAKAVIALTTSADAVRGLERLINRTPAPSTPVTPVAKDDWATIEKLMNSDAYMGHTPDPAVVKRVTQYFEQGGKRGARQ